MCKLKDRQIDELDDAVYLLREVNRLNNRVKYLETKLKKCNQYNVIKIAVLDYINGKCNHHTIFRNLDKDINKQIESYLKEKGYILKHISWLILKD